MAKKNSRGYIFLHRSITEHWIWEDERKLKWWISILMEANHSPTRVNVGFELIECNRGQSVNSLKTWAKKWRVDVGVVRRFFKLLQNDNMIVLENLQKTTRLTVCNYASYNDVRHANDTQTNFKQISNEFQTNTNNKGIINESINDNKAGAPVFPKKPKSTDLPPTLPPRIADNVKLMLSLQGVEITDPDTNKLWQVFKAQNLTGEKFYQSQEDVYRHLINWSKTQKIATPAKKETVKINLK